MKLKTVESLQKKVRKKEKHLQKSQGKKITKSKEWELILKYTQPKGIVLKF